MIHPQGGALTPTGLPPAVRPASGFERLWQSLQLETANHTINMDSTLTPRRVVPDTGDRRREVAELPRLAIDDGSHDVPELLLGETLGQGGMGLVRAATQLSLRRTVAVKSVLADHVRDATTSELLREARLTGQLEHPNIVPVYALGRDDTGAPMLVMKRIEGRSWREVLEDRPVAPDDLAHHLGILMQVCNAVHFAHAKGIVHRDLKPENVMLGLFGEVYLVDWGIAVQAGEQGQAGAGTGIAGTPAFMAPEMVSGDSGGVTPRTDVYLLGACLHVLLTGRPPHDGSDLFAVLYHAWQSDLPEYEADVPEELVALVHTAMARDPAARPEGAEAFRQGLVDFLQHRSSTQLAAEAQQRLATLATLWAQDDLDDDVQAAERMAEVYHTFGEARFGFQQALRTWAENGPAATGKQQLLEGMARYEIHHGDQRAAGVLVKELQAPSADLLAELAALGERLQAADVELQKLKALERDLDPNAARDVRAAMTWAMMVVWVVTPGIGYLAERMGWFVVGYAECVGSAVLFGALLAVSVWMYRADLLTTRLNRAFVSVLGVTAVVLLGHRIVAWLNLVPVSQTLADDLLLFGFALGSLAATIDKKNAVGAVVYLIAAVVATRLHGHELAVMAVANLLALGSVAWAWSPKKSCRLEVHAMLLRLRASRRLRHVLESRPGASVAHLVHDLADRVIERT